MDWFDGLRDWADTHAGLIALATFVIGPIVGYLALTRQRFGQKPVIDMIEKPENWQLLIDEYKSVAADRYFATLTRILGWARSFYGPKPLSMQAFNRCLALAFIYPILAMVIGWVVANQHSPGGLSLFADDPVWWSRLAKAMILVAAMALAVWIFDNIERFGAWSVEKLFASKNDSAAPAFFPAKRVKLAMVFLAAYFAFGLAASLILVVSFSLGLTAASAFAFAVLLAGQFAVFGAVFVTLAYLSDGLNEGEGLFIFLVLLLPVLNALADMLSLAATRWFLGHVVPAPTEGVSDTVRKASFPRILIQVILDLGVAAVCLALLIGMIIASLDLWGGISPTTAPFDWRAYWAGVQADRSSGWALYLMVATTLLPTAVHVGAGLGAIVTHGSRLKGRVARRLEQAQADGVALLDPEINTMVSQLHRATLWGHAVSAAIGVVILVVVGWGIIALLGLFGGAPLPS